MAALRAAAIGSLSVTWESSAEPLDGYLYSGYAPFQLDNVPVLRVRGEVCMSLTPMEVQSSYMPIRLARGRVGTAGLGLGYFAQRVLDKPEVEQVVVYELKSEVLELYLRTFGPHPKLDLRQANVRLIENERFDFFYADMYRHLLTPQAIDDMARLSSANAIVRYHWWSIEQTVFEVLQAGLAHRLPDWMLTTYTPFLQMFAEHPCARHSMVFSCGHALADELEMHGLLQGEVAESC
jgi:hypothetical protein